MIEITSRFNVGEDKNDYPLTRNADCNKVYYSLKEALSAYKLKKMVCNINLANQNLKSIPSEIYGFKNLLTLDLRGNSISEEEIKKLKSTFPSLNLQYSSPEQSQTKESLLARINFDVKGYPDASAQSTLKSIVGNLNNYKNASLRIVLYYADDYSQKAADGYLNTLKNYLQQLKYDKNSVRFELQNNPIQQQQQQQQQQNAPVSKSNSYSSVDMRYADVYGIGFPTVRNMKK